MSSARGRRGENFVQIGHTLCQFAGTLSWQGGGTSNQTPSALEVRSSCSRQSSFLQRLTCCALISSPEKDTTYIGLVPTQSPLPLNLTAFLNHLPSTSALLLESPANSSLAVNQDPPPTTPRLSLWPWLSHCTAAGFQESDIFPTERGPAGELVISPSETKSQKT